MWFLTIFQTYLRVKMYAISVINSHFKVSRAGVSDIVLQYASYKTFKIGFTIDLLDSSNLQ